MCIITAKMLQRWVIACMPSCSIVATIEVNLLNSIGTFTHAQTQNHYLEDYNYESDLIAVTSDKLGFSHSAKNMRSPVTARRSNSELYQV